MDFYANASLGSWTVNNEVNRQATVSRRRKHLQTEKLTGFFSLASPALRASEARAVCAHKTPKPRVTDFFTDFEEKTDCFAVQYHYGKLQSDYLYKTTLSRRRLRFHQPGDVVYAQAMESFF